MHAKVLKIKKEEGSQKNTLITNEKEITFDKADIQDIQDPHHDRLVITLYIANNFVRTILVDGGSLVNIIVLDALKRLNIPESKIVRRSSVLNGFSGETKPTVGEIKLPIYIEGVNFMQRFCVIDTLPSYNVILDRPWIHQLKDVPSTYHQCVKMPTPWGTMKITGDQQEFQRMLKEFDEIFNNTTIIIAIKAGGTRCARNKRA